MLIEVKKIAKHWYNGVPWRGCFEVDPFDLRLLSDFALFAAGGVLATLIDWDLARLTAFEEALATSTMVSSSSLIASASSGVEMRVTRCLPLPFPLLLSVAALCVSKYA